MIEPLRGKRVCLIGLDKERAGGLWHALATEGALVATVDTVDELKAHEPFTAAVWEIANDDVEVAAHVDPRTVVVVLATPELMRSLAPRCPASNFDFAVTTAPAAEVVTRLFRLKAARGVPMPTSPSSARVLVADDDPTTVSIVSATLATIGYSCATAADGTEALRQIRQEPFAAAVLDLQMPYIDGLEVLREIKRGGGMRVIILTSSSDEQTILDAFSAGADDFLVKPFKPSELSARLRRFIG